MYAPPLLSRRLSFTDNMDKAIEAIEVYLQTLYPRVAWVVCSRFRQDRIETLEDPHGHPEHPTDALLMDFFLPNNPKPI